MYTFMRRRRMDASVFHGCPVPGAVSASSCSFTTPDNFVVVKTGALPLHVMLPMLPGTFCGRPAGTGLPSNHNIRVDHGIRFASKRKPSRNETFALTMVKMTIKGDDVSS